MSETKWIPVTERLPEVGSRVLCYCKNYVFMVGHINVCKYCAPDKYSDEPYFDYNMNGFPQVIAWMPLPEPYEVKHERMTKKKLIDWCRSRQPDVCIFCKYFEECDLFITMTGHTPYAAPDEERTDEQVVKK